MHEMPVVLSIADTVIDFMQERALENVSTVVVEIGELSGIVPRYVEDLWIVAVENTVISDTVLVTEIIRGIGKCRVCGNEYYLIEHDGSCPECHGRAYDILCGQNVVVREIQVT